MESKETHFKSKSVSRLKVKGQERHVEQAWPCHPIKWTLEQTEQSDRDGHYTTERVDPERRLGHSECVRTKRGSRKTRSDE